jgi:hypothetical protein
MLDECFCINPIPFFGQMRFRIDPYHRANAFLHQPIIPSLDQCVLHRSSPFSSRYQATRVLLNTTPTAREASELHLHHDVELEDEDLPNIAMNNVAVDAIGDVVDVRVEDHVGICHLCYLVVTLSHLVSRQAGAGSDCALNLPEPPGKSWGKLR